MHAIIDIMGMSRVALQGRLGAKLIEVSTMPTGIFPCKLRDVIIPIGPSIAYVELTGDRFALIDRESIPLVGNVPWYAKYNESSDSFYARRSDWKTKKTISMHSVILDAGPGKIVDHISGNSLDNRRSNLRPATRSQNQINQKLSSRNTCGLKGISFDKKRGGWIAQIKIPLGKKVFLGRHKSPELAHAAYCEAAAKYHGEFARTA